VNGRGVGWIKSIESFLGSLRLLAEALTGAVKGFFVEEAIGADANLWPFSEAFLKSPESP
jgi:hypothetical protein